MSNITTQQIRTNFIDFFKQRDHIHVPSSSLVPHNDPSLMFVNSGMVQFKDIFTGAVKSDFVRATSTQKSVRAGGKHNDLDNVGYTARHHTFFEMLGNFSFGDYFKEEAIYYAWNLLTKDFALPKDKLYVTIYYNDDEAALYWKKIAGLDDHRIIRINSNDNFWSMGDVGPCGPCSEVFYDHGSHIPGGLPGTPDENGDRFIEIWNLVFMQFEQIDSNTRIELPNKSVDTGMGLERISAILQNVHDNYDIDIFKDIIGYTESILKHSQSGDALFSYRIIADHLRSSAFLIADGVMPSNEGRGYVLRRIMRRAMRHAHQLGAKEPLMYKLLPKLVDLFGVTFPELQRGQVFISSVLKQEEERFKITLDRGLKLLQEKSYNLSAGEKLSGDVAFKLYDTYGFPLDLTQDILKSQNIMVDDVGFHESMLEQKERAKKAWIGSGESKADSIWFDIMSEFGATEFLGYSSDSAEGVVSALVQHGKLLEEISDYDTPFTLIANQTPFYGESGGQIGDIGIIESEHCIIKVIDTAKYLGKIIGHVCVLQKSNDDKYKNHAKITMGEVVKFSIDIQHRNSLRAHHTATHILHAVLRDVLGQHVVQKGSFVGHDRLRFDISHAKPITQSELNLIETRVNSVISDNYLINTKIMSSESAIESGALALFGEKYEDEVRVVSLEAQDQQPCSVELCGGTHVSRTGDIGVFKIISQSSVAAGIRRIEAVCGVSAHELIMSNERLLEEAMILLKSDKGELLNKLSIMINDKKIAEKQIEKLQIEKLSLSTNIINDQAIAINSTTTKNNESNARLLCHQIDDFDPKIMRIAAENLSKQHSDLIVVYVNRIQHKLSIVISVSIALSKQYHAGLIAKQIAKIVGGNGGGQAHLSQVGGIDDTALPELKQNIVEILKNYCDEL